MFNFLNYKFYGNSSEDYIFFVFIFILSLVLFKIVQSIVIARLKKIASKTKSKLDDVLISIIAKIKPPFYLVLSLYISLKVLVLSDSFSKIVEIVFIAALLYEGIQAVQRMVQFLVYRSLKNDEDKDIDDKQAKLTAQTLTIFVKIILWSFGILLILSNAGINVNSLIAGLGIGGVAVALALQNILGDIFSSFSILVDKPFQIGDFIKIGTDMGTVEKIGIKTTRIRTLDGQVLVVSNQELTTARVENFKQIQKRRALFTIGVIYETEHSVLEKIPNIISDIVSKNNLAEFDRCHFKSFGDFSLNFEVSFYVNSSDYKEYLDTLEKINLEIFRIFSDKKIAFAYPTQMLYKKEI